MKLQTVSLEVAKKIFETGWRKRTYFEYDCSGAQGGDYYPDPRPDYDLKQSYIRSKPPLKAPQFHEILEELPDQITVLDKKAGSYNHYWLFYKMNVDAEMNHAKNGFYYMDYSNYLARENLKGSCHSSNNMHDLAALLWIWCVDNGYISLPNRDT